MPLVMGPLKTRTPRAFRVRVRETLTLDPSTETLVSCKADGDVFVALGMVETHTTLPTGVMTGRTLVDAARPSFHVLMANLSDKPVRLHSDTLVGMCEPVEVLDVHVDEKKKEKPGHGPFPEHLQELMDGVSPEVTGGDREQVQNLLAEFSDIFSATESDLGITDMTVHRINTGFHQPIKVSGRRIPVAKREEATRMID